jgi:2-(1,2-epoxy-1,2-dihydrophenyl)acetyl-CoA isomerase
VKLETIIVERSEDGIVTVTLNRPEKKNAINGPMWDELLSTFREVAASPTDRVMVLTGAGDAFCGGADLTAGGSDPRHQIDKMHHFGGVGLALHQIPKPCIAKVNGVAVGAGLNIALGCDLIVAGESARFAEIFAKRGLAIDLGGSWLLPRLVGIHKAKELALLAEMIPAREAERLGIVNRVVPDAELEKEAFEMARRIAAGPPIALRFMKDNLNRALVQDLGACLDLEAERMVLGAQTEDYLEAVRAFAEKRPPVFRGR